MISTPFFTVKHSNKLLQDNLLAKAFDLESEKAALNTEMRGWLPIESSSRYQG
jgi:hypothetical protein